MTGEYVIGIDYGTDSVRSEVVDTGNAEIAGTSVFEYPRWKKGLFCDPAINQFRQHPLDYIEGLEQSVIGALTGLSLGSDAPGIFKALVEATAFGSQMINERFISEGIRIDGVIAIGGVAKKNPFVMQIVADVLNKPLKVASSDQTCAIGSTMAASVVAGVHKDIPSAQKAMGGGFEKEYHPDPVKAKKYENLFNKYKKLGSLIENEQL